MRDPHNASELAPPVECAYLRPRADGWMTAGRKVRGKSGLHEGRVPGNARRG